ncbi:restriction endonuclease subunit S [Enterococcus faecium]|uniref:restriction endonuclease subunit S n=1 Tax=Enterococcus faecium TaxID=1352 RepID=UPI0025435B16|nr:restriction endonuclease subunit S [Enterococcus faecium]MDK4461579.1 restriction endonuclease subunit S [Enterococcus faecium]
MSNETQPEIRFPGFTEDWEERKVFEISKVTYGGGTPKTNTKEFWNGNIPWIQSSDLEINRLFNVSPKKKITSEAVKKSAAKIIPPNSIAIVTRVGVGKLALMPFEYATSQDFLSLSELQIDSYFGIFSLYSMLQKELKNIQGTSIKGMTKSDLLEKKVTIPKKYEEQQKIGNFFKQLDDTITLHQRKLDLLKETKKGFLQKMFPKNGAKVPEIRFPGFTEDWEERKLSELAEVKTGFPFKNDDFIDGGNYLVITNGNIQNNSALVDGNIGNRISAVSDEIKDKYLLNYGDILVTMDGTVGRTAKVFEKNQILAQRVGRLVANTTPEFLYQWLNTGKFFGDMTKVSHGGTIKHISLSEISDFNAFVPVNEDERVKIGSLLLNIDKTITLHQRKLDLLKEMKKGFLQKMFV